MLILKNILSFLLNFKTLGFVLVLGIGFYLGKSCEHKSNIKTIKKYDKIVLGYKENKTIDSTQNARLAFEVDSLQKDLVLRLDILNKKDIFIQTQTKSIKGLEMRLNQSNKDFQEAIKVGHITCDTIFVKPINIFEKGVYQVIDRAKIKRLVQ